MRNDLYITLEKGEFEKGGKSVARNVEVTVYALDADGQILKVICQTDILNIKPILFIFFLKVAYCCFKKITSSLHQ